MAKTSFCRQKLFLPGRFFPRKKTVFTGHWQKLANPGQKALEFSSTVLSTPSLYCTLQYKLLFNKIVSSKGTVLLSLLFIECVCVSLFSHSLCTASFQQSGQNLACGKIVTKGLCRGTTRCVKHGLERDPARSMHYKIN